MRLSALRFKRTASAKLRDARLQQALSKIRVRFVEARAEALAELEDAAAVRARATSIRDEVLRDLAGWLTRFEAEATRRGAVVHWAEDAAAACRIILEIARANGVRKVAKSKSMVSEEVALNEALAQAGVEVTETDLGEYILQLAQEPPSHIVAPVLHKSKEEVADLFVRHHGRARQDDIAALAREAREVLRPHFVGADMGLSGANFLIAETGSVLLVTNEGNGRLVTTLPRIHVALTGIEKVVPTLEDAATLLRLLPRSATGQSITNYVSLLTGVRSRDESDGPEQFHIVLLDNGRSRLIGTELEPMLRCIRCGACMNHCPVYQNVGGHAYGWVYPGPMGSVLTPALAGLAQTLPLPNASTLCGRCAEVCPVGIPLPDLLRALRARQHAARLRPRLERAALRAWVWLALHPRAYGWVMRHAKRLLRLAAGADGRLRRGVPGWSGGRDFVVGTAPTFRELYHKRP